MGTRKTASSKTVEYETASCEHCGDEVFVDDDVDNVDGLPEAVTAFVGGGEHMSVDQTDRMTRAKEYRTPKVVVKWFFGDRDGNVTQNYLCHSCADSMYGVSP